MGRMPMPLFLIEWGVVDFLEVCYVGDPVVFNKKGVQRVDGVVVEV